MFSELLWSSLSGCNEATSLIISKHLTTITNLVTGQGVEFQPASDPTSYRLKCLRKIVSQTDLQAFIPDICAKSVGTGEVLIWLRLTKSGYRIRYYPATEFTPYFKPDSDDLRAAIIRYSVLKDGKKTLFRVLVDETGYYTVPDDYKVSFTGADNLDYDNLDKSKLTYNPHPVPFFPLYLVRNKPTGPGSRSLSDFNGLEADIVAHHTVYKAVSKNVKKFARQTILTNLKKSDLMKTETTVGINIPSSRAGYKAVPLRSQVSEEEIAEYIGVEGGPGESFIQPIDWNPISSDQLQYLEAWETSLYAAMSSISKISGNTAYETRAMISVPLASANRKSNLLFDRAICLLLSDCLSYEVSLFKCPDAEDTSVTWRRIELVEPSTRDQLDTSILTRNLSEQGVGDSELLKLQFPGRTEEDIMRITGGSGGVPYRKIDKTVPAIDQLLELANKVTDPEVQLRVFNLASNLVSSLEDSLNYGKSSPGIYQPSGLPYLTTQSPESEPMGASGTGLAGSSSQGTVTDTPGDAVTDRSNPIVEFFRGTASRIFGRG